jgi:hypothetical protein
MSDIYILAIDGFLPRLRSLRIHVKNAVVQTEVLTTTRLCMSKLETFNLYLKQRRQANEGEEQVKWAAVETLISNRVMPCLRRFSFVYGVSTSAEIQDIFESSVFNNDNRHISVRFALYINASNVIDPSDIINIFNIRSSRYNELLVEYVSILFSSSLTKQILN